MLDRRGSSVCPSRRIRMRTTKQAETTRRERYVASYEPGTRYRIWFRIGNAFMRPLLRSRLGEKMQGLSVLTLTGRQTGKRYSVPVSVIDLDGSSIILTASPWKVNLRGGADVQIRAGRTTRRMRATLVEDPERVAGVYERLLPSVGVAHAKRLGLVVAGDRLPTREELIEGIRGRRAVVALVDR
jgi:hypothetical protein